MGHDSYFRCSWFSLIFGCLDQGIVVGGAIELFVLELGHGWLEHVVNYERTLRFCSLVEFQWIWGLRLVNGDELRLSFQIKEACGFKLAQWHGRCLVVRSGLSTDMIHHTWWLVRNVHQIKWFRLVAHFFERLLYCILWFIGLFTANLFKTILNNSMCQSLVQKVLFWLQCLLSFLEI